MQIKLVETLLDAQIVRMIRNTARERMTQNTRFITSQEQVAWFTKHTETKDKLYLYLDEYNSPLGYGYIRYTDKAWGTLAVLEEFQSKGYGTDIYAHLVKEARDLWLEIFSDNSPSLIAALKNGFEIQSMNDKIVLLRKDIRGNE